MANAKSVQLAVTAIVMTCGLSCMATGAAATDRTFPQILRGVWCSVSNPGEGLEITSDALEEGDGRCTLRQAVKPMRDGDNQFTLFLRCDLGIERKRPELRTEQMRIPSIADSEPLMIRNGGMYSPSNLSVYKRCKS